MDNKYRNQNDYIERSSVGHLTTLIHPQLVPQEETGCQLILFTNSGDAKAVTNIWKGCTVCALLC